MKKIILVAIVLILTQISYAGCNKPMVMKLGWKAIGDIRAILELTESNVGHFNARNICYYLGRLQVSADISMSEASKCLVDNDLEKFEQAVHLSNLASNAVFKFCEKKPNKESVKSFFQNMDNDLKMIMESI